MGKPDNETAGVYERLKADAGAQMLDLASWFKRERGVDIVCVTAIGSPGREIARIAAERAADLGREVIARPRRPTVTGRPRQAS